MILRPAFALAAAGAADPAPAVLLRRGDAELARRILMETRVGSRPARPGLGDYFGVLIKAAIGWIGSLLSRAFSGGGSFPWLELVLFVAVGATVLLVVLAIVRRILARRGRGASDRAGSRVVSAAAPIRRDAAAWRSEIEARLSKGDVAGALEALWWWLAEALAAGQPVDSSWTTRDVLARAAESRRSASRDLAAVGVELDVLMYGRRRPSAADVRTSWKRFERVVG